ncbi:uncharacterized protein [Diadema antillarum]|uniref:uncharacterized protein n=1 Tax=Diadema antillarum TaxID=105358 RepID=UPI003A8750A8
MTLTCGEGFIISGSATLQCVRLPGWSTYFPVWNASVPYCRAVDNATNDNACHDANISTTSSLITDGTSNEIQTTEQWTALQETVDTAFPVSGDLETKYTALTIGSPVSLAALALAISFIAWCKHRWKKKRRHLENSNKLSTQPLHSINTDALHRALSEHLGNKTNQEDVHHICQNRTEDHTLEGQVVSDLLNTISRPLSDVIPHRDRHHI